MNDKKQYQLREYNGGLVFEMEDSSSTVATEELMGGYRLTYFGQDETGEIGHDTFKTLEEFEKAMKEIAPINHWKANR